jgi:hypothetical protein
MCAVYSVLCAVAKDEPSVVKSKVGTAETEMDEGKPAAVTARDSETDSEQRAEPDMTTQKCDGAEWRAATATDRTRRAQLD